MLNNLLETKTTEFSNLEQALYLIKMKETRQIIMQSSLLKVTEDGFLCSKIHTDGELNARLTDFALDLLHGILKIPKSYAKRLEPELHAFNINELLSKRISPLTVVLEWDLAGVSDEQYPHVVAILPFQPIAIPHELVLDYLIKKGFSGRLFLAPGYMEARVSNRKEAIDFLPNDAFSVEAFILNSQLGLRKWPFEVSTFLTRLACTNGMIAKRNILSSKIITQVANSGDFAKILDKHLSSAMNLLSLGFKNAIEKMASREVSPEQRQELLRKVKQIAGANFLDGLFEKAVTLYDHLNEITALANRLEDRERQRRLWILGGDILEEQIKSN
jgi:hypothetical protein